MKISNTSLKFPLILFLISPLLSLIASFKSKNLTYIRYSIWGFYVFYGYVIIGSIEGTDVSRYFEMFSEFAILNWDKKAVFLNEDLTFDYFKTFSFYIVSIFSSNPRVYFAFIGFIFGFFYSGIIVNLIHKTAKIYNVLTFLLVFHFIFIIPFYSVQFVRFSTAVVVFLYFVFEYFINGKNTKFLYFSGLSILVHFTFIFPFIALILYHFLPKKIYVYFYFYLLTTVVIQPEFSTVKDIIQQYLPTTILEEKKAYLNEDYVEDVIVKKKRANWYIDYKGQILKYVTLLLVFYLVFVKSRFITTSEIYSSLFSFGLFFASLANIVSVIPSGSRFYNVSYPIIWFVLTIILTRMPSLKTNLFIKTILFFFLLFQIIVGFRYAFDSISIDLLFSNVFFMFYYVTDIPLIDFVK